MSSDIPGIEVQGWRHALPAEANPYLLQATMLACGMWGMDTILGAFRRRLRAEG